MIVKTAKYLIRRSEERAGVQFDYVHKIAETDIGLLSRYNRIFGFLDPNRNVPALAYHTARITGALSADCDVLPFVARDEDGQRSEAYFAVRAFFDLPRTHGGAPSAAAGERA